MAGEALEENLLLPQVAPDAAGVLEQAGLAPETEGVEAGEDKVNAGTETRWKGLPGVPSE